MGRPSKFDPAFKAKVAVRSPSREGAISGTCKEVQSSSLRDHELERSIAS